MRRTILRFLLAIAIACAGTSFQSVARAADATATYELQNVTFSDGAKASGSFVFDYSTNSLASWNFSVTGTLFGTNFIPAQTFASTILGSEVSYPGSAHTAGFDVFRNVPNASELILQFGGTGLHDAPPDAPLSGGNEIVRLTLFSISTSLVTSSAPTALRTALAVPEPSALLLTLAGLVVVGVSIRRRNDR